MAQSRSKQRSKGTPLFGGGAGTRTILLLSGGGGCSSSHRHNESHTRYCRPAARHLEGSLQRVSFLLHPLAVKWE